jgi:hypothetical protein
VDMLDVPPRYPVYALSPNRRFLPQQLMGWKPRGNTKADWMHGLKRLKQLKKFFWAYPPIYEMPNIDGTYLQPDYGNGVFINVYLLARQH